MHHKTAIIIPVYKEAKNLSDSERLSLTQCVSTLHNHNICIVYPKGMPIDPYKDFVENHPVFYMPFNSGFFKNIQGYNSLLLSEEFYNKLTNYDYILIYQLDAWIFEDNVDYWCSLGYDYIGAPIFENFGENKDYKMTGAQNGGFSLRKVSSSILILDRIKKIKNIYSLISKFRILDETSAIRATKKIYETLYNIKINHQYLRAIVHNSFPNEDYTWSEFFAKTFDDYKVCPGELASEFAFELHPSYLYKKNCYKLPMGCHAWEKHEPEFWKKFIP